MTVKPSGDSNTQVIITSIRRNCSVSLYSLIKKSDYILSEFRWEVLGRVNFLGGVERKLFSFS